MRTVRTVRRSRRSMLLSHWSRRRARELLAERQEDRLRAARAEWRFALAHARGRDLRARAERLRSPTRVRDLLAASLRGPSSHQEHELGYTGHRCSARADAPYALTAVLRRAAMSVSGSYESSCLTPFT